MSQHLQLCVVLKTERPAVWPVQSFKHPALMSLAHKERVSHRASVDLLGGISATNPTLKSLV